MPDRADIELILLDAKRGLGLSELDIGFPELLVGPVGDVGTQHIGTFRALSPIIELGLDFDLQAKPRRTRIRFQADLETRGGTLVLLKEP